MIKELELRLKQIDQELYGLYLNGLELQNERILIDHKIERLKIVNGVKEK